MLKERITFSLFVLIVIMVTLFVAYSKRDSVLSSTTTPEPVAVTTEGTGKTSLANPASTFCVEHGGTLVPKKDEKGEYSMCDFGEKGVCEEWALFRGECSIPSVSVTAVYKNASSTVTVIYRGEKESSTAILDAPAFGYTDTTLIIALSGSGARYISTDGTVEFWEHQGEGTLRKNNEVLFVGKVE
jgi:putative hemolysin/membrane-bound inhibitor of C-type lysozyme